jgi:hypothetical protein
LILTSRLIVLFILNDIHKHDELALAKYLERFVRQVAEQQVALALKQVLQLNDAARILVAQGLADVVE